MAPNFWSSHRYVCLFWHLGDHQRTNALFCHETCSPWNWQILRIEPRQKGFSTCVWVPLSIGGGEVLTDDYRASPPQAHSLRRLKHGPQCAQLAMLHIFICAACECSQTLVHHTNTRKDGTCRVLIFNPRRVGTDVQNLFIITHSSTTVSQLKLSQTTAVNLQLSQTSLSSNWTHPAQQDCNHRAAPCTWWMDLMSWYYWLKMVISSLQMSCSYKNTKKLIFAFVFYVHILLKRRTDVI